MKLGFVFVVVALACGPFIEEETAVAGQSENTGRQCAIFEHCTPEQIDAALNELCPVPATDDGGERGVSQTTTTTTTVISSDVTTTTTLNPRADILDYYCRHYTKTRKGGFNCMVIHRTYFETCKRYRIIRGEVRFWGCSFTLAQGQ